MKTIKLIAVNIDGMLLENTFSPIICSFVSSYNLKYDRDKIA